MKGKYQIYCDMDGVLVDFNKGYYELTGHDITGKYLNDESFWNPINSAGQKFWAGLEWMKDGKKLWRYIAEYNPIILSAPSREVESRTGKFEWVNKELPGTHLILRTPKNKKEFATPNSVLIDDRAENIDDWKNSGGIGILHKSANDTITQLQLLGL